MLLVAFLQVVSRVARDGDEYVRVGGGSMVGLVAVFALLAIPYWLRRGVPTASLEFVAASLLSAVGYWLMLYGEDGVLGPGVPFVAILAMWGVVGVAAGTRSFLPAFIVLFALGALEQALRYEDVRDGFSRFDETFSPYGGAGLLAFVAFPAMVIGALLRPWFWRVIRRHALGQSADARAPASPRG